MTYRLGLVAVCDHCGHKCTSSNKNTEADRTEFSDWLIDIGWVVICNAENERRHLCPECFERGARFDHEGQVMIPTLTEGEVSQ